LEVRIRTRNITPILIVLVLSSASLACTLERGDNQIAETEINLPTLAPTEAPSPASPESTQENRDATPEVPNQPSQEYPIVIQSAGTKADYSASAKSECKADALAVLVIQADGTTELTTTGPGFVDHINCKTSAYETYIFGGTADLSSETVFFESCNNANFTAEGIVSYAGGSMEGLVSCANQSGDKMTLTIPR
jgi:hypothetical protein